MVERGRHASAHARGASGRRARRMGQIAQLEGTKFGLLTVLRLADNRADRGARWLCRCECGNNRIVFGYDLKRGNTRSCGCLRRRKGTNAGHPRKPAVRT
jgi:hypothetical protein